MPEPEPANASECVEAPEAFAASHALIRRLVDGMEYEISRADAREPARKG